MAIKNISIKISAVLIFFCLLYAFSANDTLSSSEDRGRLIYTKGVRSSGVPIKAKLSGAEFDAKILPCANCHGSKGAGNPEGGVEPSPLDWSSLTKSYSVAFKNGRKRSGYDHSTLKEAIVKGVDPSGNKLDLVMPRYDLNDEDVSDLISYLKIIDDEDLVGVTDSSIHIGVILRSRDETLVRYDAICEVMNAYLDLVNSGGGIYNRKLKLSHFLIDDFSTTGDSSLNQMLQNQEIFAFIASDLENLPPSSLATLEDSKVPIIGAITGNPTKHEYIRNNFYYLFNGDVQQIDALVSYAIDSLNGNTSNLVALCDSNTFKCSKDTKDFVDNTNIKLVSLDATGTNFESQLKELKDSGYQNCLFLGDTKSSLSFLEHSKKANWDPTIFMLGKFANSPLNEVAANKINKIYYSFPIWMSDRNTLAMKQYDKMAAQYALTDNYKYTQWNSLAATILFTEVLKLNGKDLNRESMVETLHGLQDFESGFAAPISFGPNKRIGTEKVSIVTFDMNNKKFILVNE